MGGGVPTHVRPANEIAAQFAHRSLAEPATAIANHMNAVWDPRMKQALINHANSGATDLAPPAALAAQQLHTPRPTPPRARQRALGTQHQPHPLGGVGSTMGGWLERVGVWRTGPGELTCAGGGMLWRGMWLGSWRMRWRGREWWLLGGWGMRTGACWGRRWWRPWRCRRWIGRPWTGTPYAGTGPGGSSGM
ncbi:hypothetical protein GCM10010530_75760 [Kribbella aluminosa]